MRPYDVLKSLDGLPLAVIQSTQDGYLPAAEARRLFGPDGEWRRFYAVRRTQPHVRRRSRRPLRAGACRPRMDRGRPTADDRRGCGARCRPVLGLILFAVALVVLRRELHAVTWHELTSDVLATPASSDPGRAAPDRPQLRGPHRLRPAGLRLHRQPLVALARGRGLVPRLRRGQQRGLRHVLGRRRALPLLHALGRHRRGAVADRVLLLGHLLAGAPRPGRARASWRARFPAPTSCRRTSWSPPWAGCCC